MKNKTGRPKEYDGEMQKKNLRLPKYIWEWLDNLSTNRTKALIQLYNERKISTSHNSESTPLKLRTFRRRCVKFEV